MFAKWKKRLTVSDKAHLEQQEQEELQKSLQMKLALYEEKQQKRIEYAAKVNKKIKVKIADYNSGPVHGLSIEELPMDEKNAKKVSEAKSAWDETLSGRENKMIINGG